MQPNIGNFLTNIAISVKTRLAVQEPADRLDCCTFFVSKIQHGEIPITASLPQRQIQAQHQQKPEDLVCLVDSSSVGDESVVIFKPASDYKRSYKLRQMTRSNGTSPIAAMFKLTKSMVSTHTTGRAHSLWVMSVPFMMKWK